ncbi:MAG: MmcQ/YjbR family DNA-binding protein [Chloroflexi bacterium]|uniref:hypothetical protein n=1 Tax=Candidatus Flexifilum breve TaxID=3140694 RepID=UPI003136DFC3|nr:MmcQ/YjbR family DNA-binding protein [Chloroflexota bacterium]
METTYREDHKAALDRILGVIPGVKISKAFGYPAYKIGGRIFCWVGQNGVTIKLPRERVDELVGSNGMHPFGPTATTVWREWLAIDREQSDDYRHDLELFEESISFVSGAF